MHKRNYEIITNYNKKFRVVVARNNPQHSYYLAVALQKTGMLEALYTGLYTSWFVSPFRYFNWLPNPFKQFIERSVFKRVQRSHVDLNPDRIQSIGVWTNIIMALLFRVGINRPWDLPIFRADSKKFQLEVINRCKYKANAIVLYDTLAYYALLNSINSHMIRIIDMATIHWRKREEIIRSEQEKWPQYAALFPYSPLDRNLVHQLSEEPKLADYLLVGSDYTKSTYTEEGIAEGNIYVAYYGCNTELFHPPAKIYLKRDFLRILFVGNPGLAKGFHILLMMLDELNDLQIEVYCCGMVDAKVINAIQHMKHRIQFLGFKPHTQMATLMRQVDVMCHPSLFDNLSLACLEGMASGLPVITTFHNGASELMTTGSDGFVVAPGDYQAMADIIRTLYNKPNYRLEVGKAARSTAEKYTWKQYEMRIMEIFNEIAISSK